MSFNLDSNLLAVTSDKGTCHLFYICSEEEIKKIKPESSEEGYEVDLENSEWSFAIYTFNSETDTGFTKCAFLDTKNLVCKFNSSL